MFALLLALVPSDPIPLASKIEEVTLYSDTALVRRRANLTASGQYVLRGLPATLDPANVRVHADGGDVIHVETRDRVQEQVENARLQALRDRVESLDREHTTLGDQRDVIKAITAHLLILMRQEERAHELDLASGKADPVAWARSDAFFAQHLADNAKSMRESDWRVEDQARLVGAAAAELSGMSSSNSVKVYDVIVDVEARGTMQLDVEYFVSGTGWQPTYDLRTAKDLSNVELTYRARIEQQSGEDWSDIALALSTARPQIGAQGSDPRPIWLSLLAPESRRETAMSLAKRKDAAAPEGADDVQHEVVDVASGGFSPAAAAPKPRPFANVVNEGLSVRFQLPQHANVESRAQPTTVLVGSAKLAIKAERRCVPALDPTVWLRGKAKNTSAWTLLPGTAAVFFGADYLGPAQIDTVQPGQELTLALGADPSVSVTRTLLTDLSKGPAFLSNKASKVESWKIHFENHGGVGAEQDGSVEVLLQEVLPRLRDERIAIEITKAEPKPSDEALFKKDKDEKGIQTWRVRVPRGGASDVLFETTTSYPKGERLVRQ